MNLDLPQELKEVKPFYRWERLQVTTESEMAQAGQAVAEISRHLKRIDEERLKVVGPIKQGVAYFEGKCRDITGPLKKIDDLLRSRIARFMDQRQARLEAQANATRAALLVEEARKRAEAANVAMTTGSEVAAQEVELRTRTIEKMESKPVEVSQTVRSQDHTMVQTKVWKWKVTDEKLIPRHLLIVDEKKLNQLARSCNSETAAQVPGVEFFQETRIAMKA